MAAMFPEHDVELWDCIAEKMGWGTFAEKIDAFCPDWVVFLAASTTLTNDMRVRDHAHRVGAHPVVVSPHFAGGDKGAWNAVHVITYKEDPEYELRRIITGIKRDGEDSFSTLPPARQDLLPLHRYSLPFIGRDYTFVITSRGCPWKCIYCRQTVTWKSRVQSRSPESVVEEINRYGLKNIAFHSDTFTYDREWVIKLCSLMPKGVRWICNSRTNTVDPELLRVMKEAGCWMICYGCESGSDKVLEMNKKGASVDDTTKAVKWTKQAGIKVWGYFMLGMYGDDKRSMRDTIRLSKRLPFDIVNFAVAAPYLGTEWYDICMSNGWLTTTKPEDFDQNYSAIVNQPDCSTEDVLYYQKKAYKEWYGSWRGIKFLYNCKHPRHWKYLFNTIKAHM